VEDLLGERLRSATFVEAAWLDSAVFLNRGDHFEVRPLPVEAQFAPAFAVCAADFDGDGAEDLFLSQNFFASLPDTPRCDAGLGLVLRGDGRGGFRALPAAESGVSVPGEQRGAAVCDYDGDGRVDLAVSQNAAATKLYRNTAGQPGLRVRLLGPKDNPRAVGARVRVVSDGTKGPAREVRAGSGYWSQDSAVLVFAAPPAGAKLEVKWPGGRETISDLPASARGVEVDATGRTRTVR
jgi:hypothetical protein